MMWPCKQAMQQQRHAVVYSTLYVRQETHLHRLDDDQEATHATHGPVFKARLHGCPADAEALCASSGL